MTATTLKPILKWAGGKARLCPEFKRRGLIPPKFETYYEPFAGGAALFFYLRPARAVLMDTNEELLNVYAQARDHPQDLLDLLLQMKTRHSEEFFYETRAQQPASLNRLERAARTIYLNKTCFNGLYRVNAKGEFNVPFGRYANPGIVDADALYAASEALRHAELIHADFGKVESLATSGDFVYFDPPYDPLSATSNFTSYTKAPFGRAEQERLALTFGRMASRGVHGLLSNSDTPWVRSLYAGYHFESFRVPRFINSKAGGRGPVGEVAVATLTWPRALPYDTTAAKE